MAKKSILDQIESGERARLMLVAPDQRDDSSGFRGSDEYRNLLQVVMYETRRDRNADMDQIESGERVRLVPAASDQRTESGGFRNMTKPCISTGHRMSPSLTLTSRVNHLYSCSQ